MDRHTLPRVNTQIYDEACGWFIEARAGDLDESSRREFAAWLRKSPEHMRAYLDIAAIWNEGPHLDPNSEWSQERLVTEAGKEPDNIVRLLRNTLELSNHPPEAAAPAARRLSGSPPKRRGLAAAACVACALALGGAWLLIRDRMEVYSTAIGEQRSIELADHSKVQLDSRSSIRLSYSDHERNIELLEGQALFEAGKDPQRPFIVTVGSTRIRAVGTQFDVYRKTSGVVVTVVEGRVAVLPGPMSNTGQSSTLDVAKDAASQSPSLAGLLLSAGERLTVTSHLAQKAEHTDVSGATAWTQRQLVFNSATLAEVAEEFNRYNRRQLAIEDPDLVDFHISGVFSSSDPTSLIRFLKFRVGVRVIETASEIRLARNIS